MLYFDYSATSPVSREVLDEFIKYSSIEYNDELGLIEKNNIKSLLNTSLDVVFTSGSTESNNMALKGIAFKYNEPGYHIITTSLEHSSIDETLSFLEKKGFIIDYVNLIDGVVDLNHLKSLICDKTILVSICSVNSETGLLQPIDKIGSLLSEYPNVIFHSDMTQSIGKVKVDFSLCDMVSFTSHKFFGIKGIGVLLKKDDLYLVPLLYGDRTYNYGLIKSFVHSLRLAFSDYDNKYRHVLSLNKYLCDKLISFSNIIINSNENCIPHILNISVMNYKPETLLHRLEMDDIFISTKSACSSDNSYSHAVYALTNDILVSSKSVRISLSYLTTFSDIDRLISVLEEVSHE